MGNYILNAKGDPVQCSDMLQWYQWMQATDRHVKKDYIKVGGNIVFLSTVFLGIAHNFFGEGDLMLWETMIFDESKSQGNELHLYQNRYSSLEDALLGHKNACKLVRSKLIKLVKEA